MKRIKQNKSKIILCILLFLLFTNICFAQSKMTILSNKQTMKKEEEVSIKIQISDTQIASCTLEIYWDLEKLEYKKGPEMSHYSNNRTVYTWVSDTGKNKASIETEEFVWKALQDGTVNIVVLGEFYNESGERVEIDNSNLQLEIGEKEAPITPTEQNETQKVEANNTNLKILRLNQEGISPEFKKEIKEYYFVTDTIVDNLEVTAIPENKNATVVITGNRNLNIGKNTIEIHVTSEDKTQEAVYKIYVTKTNNKQTANANLENLAIRESIINPEFDSSTTKYKAEIANQVNKIDILAIPQSQKATVTITGNDDMKIGDNQVQINVLAEDAITNKKYEIVVHRRNEQEELQYEKEQQIQVERLSTLLQEKEQENSEKEMEKEQKNSSKWMPLIILTLFIGIVLGYAIYKKQKGEIKMRH